MARKVAGHFIDNESVKQALSKYRKKRVLPILIGALSKDECASKRVLEQISPAGARFLGMRLKPDRVRVVLIASDGVTYADLALPSGGG